MYQQIFNSQRQYFLDGSTRDINNRIAVLKRIKNSLLNNQEELFTAFKIDFNKSRFDVLTTELLLVLDEIDFLIKNVKKFFKKKRVKTNLINYFGKSYVINEPYGNVLIIAPWNYPLQLCLLPVVDALACGNTVILKPSESTPQVSKVIEKVFAPFDKRLICVMNGDHNLSNDLLKLDFDYVFFTGSKRIGQIVMHACSEHLSPCTLELGGKSPCIVMEKANIDKSAKRIVWGKFLNAGQTCVAPDYVLIDKKIKNEFILKVKEYIKEFYYEENKLSDNFTSIINEKHLKRLINLIPYDRVISGGNYQGLMLEPTVIDNVSFDDLLMKEEIFGPILPIISYDDLSEMISKIKSLDRPLALYVFNEDTKEAFKIFNDLSFGGGCINDVIMHLCNPNLPFGGVKQSGIGNYHGMYSLKTFTHQKSLYIKGKIEINLKYPPNTKRSEKILRRITKL